MRTLNFLILFCLCCLNVVGQEVSYQEKRQIIYTSSQDSYAQQQCQLDLYYPEGGKDFVTLVWFHGGGLTSGDKTIPHELKNNNFAVVSAGYRFAPKVQVEDIIKDAAEAVKWTKQNIQKFGGNSGKIIIGGYSAGAYLALMLGLQKDYLQAHQIDANQLLGILSCSGQAITHFTERQHLQMKDTHPLINRLAPLFWVRADAAPIFLYTGDRELEMLGRYEENAYLARMLKLTGHKNVHLYEFQGYGHGMLQPAFPLIIQYIKSINK